MSDWLTNLSKEQFLMFTGVLSFLGGILSSVVVNRWAHEHATRFTKLHEQRADKIRQLYALVIDLEHQMDILRKRASASTKREHKVTQMGVVKQATENFEAAYRYDRIYFPPRMCAILDDIVLYANTLTDTFRAFIQQELATSEFKGDWSSIALKLKKGKHLLEREFRSLMGVSAGRMIDRLG